MPRRLVLKHRPPGGGVFLQASGTGNPAGAGYRRLSPTSSEEPKENGEGLPAALPHSVNLLTTTTPPAGRNPSRGFALLITITLLAFLVLLLVALASLTRVETQVASNNQHLARARQNALMALNIALGQLQKYTGPDQRITAPADIASAADGTRLAANATAQNTASVNGTLNGLCPAGTTASVQAGTRYWTGVWGRAGASYAIPAKSIYEETPSPVLLNWLVSGNEDRVFTTDGDGLVRTSDADGRTAAATAPFTPGAPVNWSAAGLNPASPSTWSSSAFSHLEIKASGQKAVLLVGPKTAGIDPVNGEAAAERYVVAPMRNIEIPASSVPGLGSATTSTTIGRYAWWVGDEGVKASYALIDPNTGNNTPDNTGLPGAKSRLRLMTASRSGIELITGFDNYPAATATAAEQADLAKLIQLPQAALLDADLAQGTGPEMLRSHIHDFSAVTDGVLSDTLNGGLRKDLTHYFEMPESAWNASALADTGIIPPGWSPNWGTAASPDYAPKWDLLYSFYNTNPGGTLSARSLAVRPETPTRVGIGPVLTQFRTAFFTDLSLVPMKNPPTPGNVKEVKDGTYSWPIRCNVVFVLANPYNVTLTSPAGEMEFVIKNTSTATGTSASEGHANKLLILAYNWGSQADKYGEFNLLREQNSTEPEGFLDTVKFVTPDFSIPPGGSVTLSVAGQQQLTGTNFASEEPVNTVQLAVNDGSNPVRPIPDAPTASDSFFTSRQPFNFTTDSINGPANPLGAPGRSIVANYAYGNPNYSITLRQGSTGAVYQQIRDIVHTKNGDMGGFQNAIMGNIMLKFMAPADRNVTGAFPLNASSGGGDKSLFYLVAQGRVFQDYNIRAAIIDHPNISGRGTAGSGDVFPPPPYATGLFNAPGSPATTVAAYFSNYLTPAPWAEDIVPGDGTYGRNSVSSRGVLFDFPLRTDGQPPVLSLGQLQHASLTADDYNPVARNPADLSRTARGSVVYQSGYAVANSYAPPLTHRAESVSLRRNEYRKSVNGDSRYFDLSYLLNTSLWDGYFFSGIAPESGADLSPRNPRYALRDGASAATAQSPDSAAQLLVNGAFNINSTSRDAWVALISGLNTLRVNKDSTAEGVPYPRTLWQPVDNTKTGATFKTSGTDEETYAGYRRLTADEIRLLADEIVKRVRARGPFVSLSHFINRSLVAASGDFNASINDADTSGNLAAPAVPMGRGFAGPLQAAIDSTASGINTFINTGAGDVVTGNAANAYGDRLLFNGSVTPTNTYVPRSDNTGGIYFADMKVDWAHTNWRYDQSAPPGPYGRTSTGTPGWLLQGDILQALGPALSVRSDTFTIRTYGETVNPLDSTQTLARAWCEAVVQRLPDYVDSVANPAEAPRSALSPDNLAFGRGYKVVSFRWLSAEDI
ncbi:MAG: hypothetical protein WC661_19320 [Opitutaceae bacterium]|jgi:Tfp pilus assembly protein PilX